MNTKYYWYHNLLNNMRITNKILIGACVIFIELYQRKQIRVILRKY